MTEVKHNISTLCRVLKLTGLSNLVAEDVRKAKFDKLVLRGKLWQTLHNACILLRDSGTFCTTDGTVIGMAEVCNCPQLSLLTQQNLPDELSSPKETFSVISHVMGMLDLMQFSSSSYWPALMLAAESALSQDSTAETGHSRVLLIAVCWLMAKYSMADCIVHWTHRQAMTCLPRHCTIAASHTGVDSRAKAAPSFQSTGDQLNHLVASVGRLRSAARSVRLQQEDAARLGHRILTCVAGASSSAHAACTVRDVQLLWDKKRLDEVCSVVHKANTILANIVAWKSSEDKFWMWADSVLQMQEEHTTSGMDHWNTTTSNASDEKLVQFSANPLPAAPLYRASASQDKRRIAVFSQSSATLPYCSQLAKQLDTVRTRQRERAGYAQQLVQEAVARNTSLVVLQ
eukprot:scpid70205/ scgid19544/ 